MKILKHTFSANIYLLTAQCPRPQDKKGYYMQRYRFIIIAVCDLAGDIMTCESSGVETIFDEPIALRYVKGIFLGSLLGSWQCCVIMTDFPLSFKIFIPKKLLLIKI